MRRVVFFDRYDGLASCLFVQQSWLLWLWFNFVRDGKQAWLIA
jgi:hypothetical protein